MIRGLNNNNRFAAPVLDTTEFDPDHHKPFRSLDQYVGTADLEILAALSFTVSQISSTKKLLPRINLTVTDRTSDILSRII